MASSSVTSIASRLSGTPINKRWRWRRSLLYMCFTFAEILWITPFLMALMRLLDNPLPMEMDSVLSLVSVNMLGAMILRRILINRDVGDRQQVLVMILGLIVSILLSVSILPILVTTGNDTLNFNYVEAFTKDRNGVLPDGIIIAPMVFALFLRGISIGRSSLMPTVVGVMMRFGILVFFIIALFAPQDLADDMLTILPLFFFFILITNALAYASSLKLDSEVQERRFGMPWVGFLSAIAIFLSGIGLSVAALLAGVDRDKVLEILKIPFIALFTLIFIIASPLLYAAEKLFSWMQGVLAEPSPVKSEILESGPREVQTGNNTERFFALDIIQDVIAFVTDGVGLFLIVGTVSIVLVFWLSMFFLGGKRYNDEDSEHIDRRENVKGGLRKAFAKRFKRLGNTLGLVKRFGLGRELFGALTIRWIYSRMERLGKKRGFPRQDAQTPYEYQAQLEDAFPGGDPDIRLITDAYVAIRYGELPEDGQKLDHVRDAFERLKRIPVR